MKHLLMVSIMYFLLCVGTIPVMALDPGVIVPIDKTVQLTLPTSTPTPTSIKFTFPPIKKVPIVINTIVPSTPTATVTPSISVSPDTVSSESPTVEATPGEDSKEEATVAATSSMTKSDKLLFGGIGAVLILIILIQLFWPKIKIWLHNKTAQ